MIDSVTSGWSVANRLRNKSLKLSRTSKITPYYSLAFHISFNEVRDPLTSARGYIMVRARKG